LKTEIEPLPSEWVDVIFTKLTMRHGRDFLSRYEGVDLAAVKADWAEELAGLQNRPGAIKYALELSVAKAPNVIEFRELCSRAPVRANLSLPAPRADQDVIDRALRKASEVMRKRGDPLDPIRELRRRELEGDKTLTQFQREFWRKALKSELERAA
jgi:hypothetical protein